MTKLYRGIIILILCLLVEVASYAQEDSTLPAIPAIDTTTAPADALTTEIKRMLELVGSMDLAVETMKRLMDAQRQSPDPRVPVEFYDRFSQLIEGGRVKRLLENVIVKVYREKFTIDEMKELNRFYTTTIGKKVAKELPGIYAKSSTEGEKLGEFLAMEIVTAMMSEGKWK